MLHTCVLHVCAPHGSELYVCTRRVCVCCVYCGWTCIPGVSTCNTLCVYVCHCPSVPYSVCTYTCLLYARHTALHTHCVDAHMLCTCTDAVHKLCSRYMHIHVCAVYTCTVSVHTRCIVSEFPCVVYMSCMDMCYVHRCRMCVRRIRAPCVFADTVCALGMYVYTRYVVIHCVHMRAA